MPNTMPEHLEECPITLYFLETKDKVKGKWTFMKWLEFLDTDSFNMINQSIDAIQEIPAEEFDPENPTEEGHDIAMLHVYALLEERYKKVKPNILESLKEEVVAKIVEENDIAFMLDYIAYEGMRREGNATIKGSGKLLDKNTDVVLTEKGEKMMQKALDSLKDEDDLFTVDEPAISCEHSAKKEELNKDDEYLSAEETYADFVRDYELDKHKRNFSKNIKDLENLVEDLEKHMDISKTKKLLHESSVIISDEIKYRLEDQYQQVLRVMNLCDSFIAYLESESPNLDQKLDQKTINEFRGKIIKAVTNCLQYMKELKVESSYDEGDFEDEEDDFEEDYEHDCNDSGEEWKKSCDKKDPSNDSD